MSTEPRAVETARATRRRLAAPRRAVVAGVATAYAAAAVLPFAVGWVVGRLLL